MLVRMMAMPWVIMLLFVTDMRYNPRDCIFSYKNAAKGKRDYVYNGK